MHKPYRRLCVKIHRESWTKGNFMWSKLICMITIDKPCLWFLFYSYLFLTYQHFQFVLFLLTIQNKQITSFFHLDKPFEETSCSFSLKDFLVQKSLRPQYDSAISPHISTSVITGVLWHLRAHAILLSCIIKQSPVPYLKLVLFFPLNVVN